MADPPGARWKALPTAWGLQGCASSGSGLAGRCSTQLRVVSALRRIFSPIIIGWRLMGPT
eukprot:11136213-Alexandrium_andersonii.AAC.1